MHMMRALLANRRMEEGDVFFRFAGFMHINVKRASLKTGPARPGQAKPDQSLLKKTYNNR